jgi:hypothetical protein
MATKRLDPKNADPNISRPNTDPEAANLTIPRRELLTGSALVLLAGCCKPAATGGGASWQLRTQFMADFTSRFIGDPTTIKAPGTLDLWPDPARKWPQPGQTKTEYVADYLTFANVLLTVGHVQVQPSPPFTNPASLGYQIVEFLNNNNWPTATPVFPPPVPPPAPPPLVPYQNDLTTVHLLEIAVILDRLLQAMNSFNRSGGGGGGPGGWPPH